jgi:hypothetical protein
VTTGEVILRPLNGLVAGEDIPDRNEEIDVATKEKQRIMTKTK